MLLAAASTDAGSRTDRGETPLDVWRSDREQGRNAVARERVRSGTATPVS